MEVEWIIIYPIAEIFDSLNMAKLGFKVKELIGGIEWRKKDGYATEGKRQQQVL